MKLFESMIRPIITYDIEIWGLSHIEFHMLNADNDIESCYDKKCYDTLAIRHVKYLLQVHKNSTNIALRGELCAFPLYILLYRTTFVHTM